MSPSLVETSRTRFTTTLRQALIAGIAAGVLSLIEIFVTIIMPAHDSLSAFFSMITAVACGKTPPPFDTAIFGALAHFAISIGWAYGYAHLAARNSALSRSPWVSGTVFGLLVFLGMQSILLSVHQFHSFTPLAFLNNIVLHTVFFGIPIALIVARNGPLEA